MAYIESEQTKADSKDIDLKCDTFETAIMQLKDIKAVEDKCEKVDGAADLFETIANYRALSISEDSATSNSRSEVDVLRASTTTLRKDISSKVRKSINIITHIYFIIILNTVQCQNNIILKSFITILI